jgi:hypothetical protein
MPPRTLQQRNEFGALFSGDLESALQRHGADRILHFFYFCFYVELTCDYLTRLKFPISPREAITDHATHQVDKGTRSSTIQKLEVYSLSPADLRVTGHGSMDAAHTNNLGLSRDFVKLCERNSASDPVVYKLYGYCKDLCSNTTLLPQSINLGPDKVIDKIHRDMCNHIFSPLSTRPRIKESDVKLYGELADYRLRVMQQKKEEKTTLAATAEYYLAGIDSVIDKVIGMVGLEATEIIFALNAHLSTSESASNYIGSPALQPSSHLSPTRFRKMQSAPSSVSEPEDRANDMDVMD